MSDFDRRVSAVGPLLRKGRIDRLQMNLGYACNLNCRHCHLEAGPHRSEQMPRAVIDDCLDFATKARVKTIDLTGGAPELHPELHYLVEQLRRIDSVESILLRSNLTALALPEHTQLPHFLRQHRVDIIASLPCYLEDNVSAQRGTGVFVSSLRVLQALNLLGYGIDGPGLHLVYNPGGDFLPPPQAQLESLYRERLAQDYGISFNQLFTIANMPLGRFRAELETQDRLESYQALLAENFNPQTLGRVMCLHQINVDWRGLVYDCDFNQALRQPIHAAANSIGAIAITDLTEAAIITGLHCFACTAGAGSSCQGSLTEAA